MAHHIWDYLKNNSRFGILIDQNLLSFSLSATELDKERFNNIYPNAKEDKVTSFL